MAVVVSATIAGSAFAQESASDAIEPRVDRAQFAMLVQKLGLDNNQRTIVELAFSDYSQALTDLARELDQKAVAAGRDTVQDALRGKARVPPDDLRRMRAEVQRAYLPAGPIADKAFEDLLMNIEIVLAREQLPIFEQAARQFRREAYLRPRAAAADDQEYAGEGVDIVALVESATREGGELHSIGRGPFEDILASYESQMDELLRSSAGAYRDAKLKRKIAQIERNAAQITEQERTLLGLWKPLYELNKNAAEQIAGIAESSSDTAKQRWLDRFDQACFVWLYPRKKPDRQIEWIRSQSVPAAQLQKAEAIYDQYVSRRRALARRAIDLMLRGRLEFETILYSMMDSTGMDDRVRRGAHEELLKNTGEQATLESNTAAELEAALEPAKREALRDAMKRPDTNRRR